MDEIITVLFYPTFLIGVFLLTLIFIPKNKYKEYFRLSTKSEVFLGLFYVFRP